MLELTIFVMLPHTMKNIFFCYDLFLYGSAKKCVQMRINVALCHRCHCVINFQSNISLTIHIAMLKYLNREEIQVLMFSLHLRFIQLEITLTHRQRTEVATCYHKMATTAVACVFSPHDIQRRDYHLLHSGKMVNHFVLNITHVT